MDATYDADKPAVFAEFEKYVNGGKFDLEYRIVRPEGDTALLRIALENLLNNAWKFSAGKNPTRIEFGNEVQRGKEVFYIRDNGTGFDIKYAEKLFAAFQRLHDAKTYPGTGIGLSIVSRIIKRHGGEIWAEGEDGKGACFYFTLP